MRETMRGRRKRRRMIEKGRDREQRMTIQGFYEVYAGDEEEEEEDEEENEEEEEYEEKEERRHDEGSRINEFYAGDGK